MKKIRKKFKKLNNRGSSIVMVVVALAFIGIIVGALLTAAGYSYRLKLQDLNARDNFYYVEQAMNEIYAGVGSQTVKDMQDAYIYTVEHMVEYDLDLDSYTVAKKPEELEKMFNEQFIKNLMNNPFFSNINNLPAELEKFISNETVVLNSEKLYVDYVYPEGKVLDENGKTNVPEKIIIRNVTLNRTQEYDKSSANGTYTQTITADIEIGEPDFSILFNGLDSDYANIFKFAIVADMGVEINQPTTPVTIAGNVYAASDYYNKKYNESTYMAGVKDEDKKFIGTYPVTVTDPETGVETTENVTLDDYTHGSVTSRQYDPEGEGLNTYYNVWSTLNDPSVAGERDYFDGVHQRSMYSGLYIDGSSVSILADTIIVPGSIAVMNTGNLSVYGKDGKATSEAEIWTDNLVLGGYSTKKTEQNTLGESEVNYKGATAVLRADLYVKDDTEINASGANLQIRGSYYGYGDSTERDERVFLPTVNSENFQVEVTDSEGNIVTENRGHYNSSAIIVNGQKSTIDLAQTNTIYLAGRSYIEMSKNVTEAESMATIDDEVVTTVTETYEFTPKTDDLLSANPDDTVFMRDYKTGESLSIKSNQLAYIPIMLTGIPTPVLNSDGSFAYWSAKLDPAVANVGFFETYFPQAVFGEKVPAVMQEVSGKKYYYYDFETAYNKVLDALGGSGTLAGADFKATYPSAQFYASHFIEDYVSTLNLKDDKPADVSNPNYPLKEHLTDIGDYEDFEAGDIILPDAELNPNVTIYSSGALTTKNGVEFNIVRNDDWHDIDALLSSTQFNDGAEVDFNHGEGVNYGNAYKYSNDLEIEYDFVKWNLGHFSNPADIEKLYIKDLVANADFGDASITPINKFLNFDAIADNKLRPKLNDSDSATADGILDLASGYAVWLSPSSIVVRAREGDGGVVRGMVISKGDVYFDPSVISFEGIVISGGKVYMNDNLTSITSSAEICRTILRECQLSSDPKCKVVLNLFKGYEVSEDDEGIGEDGGEDIGTPGDAKTIDNIDYSDVVRFNNWMKNVE